MNKLSPIRKNPVSEFDCACVIDSLTAHTIPDQIKALRESLALLDAAESGIGDIDGKSPRTHAQDALNGLDDMADSIKASFDVAQAWLDQDARRRKEG